MDKKRDPVYRALNAQKPNKQKTLAAALAEMKAAPNAKARIPFYQVKRVMAACLIVFFVALVPFLIFRYTDVLGEKGGGNAPENTIDAPHSPSYDSNYIEFDLDIANGYKGGNESLEDYNGVVGSYKNYDGEIEETVTIFFYDGEIPPIHKTVYIDKLGVTGYYTAEPAEALTLIKLYFSYNGTDYLVEVYCTGEDRLQYYLSEIIGNTL